MNNHTSFLYNLAKNRLFKINRSLTGNGNKETLKIFKKIETNLKIKSFKSTQKVYNWEIPKEWNVKKAYVIDKFKKKIIDFNNNNLHLVGYSIPIRKKIRRDKLIAHLHTLKNQPDVIPYVTSYYKSYWGFCVSDYEKDNIIKKYNKNDFFEVCIDSNFNKNGRMHYAEYYIKGKSKKEILISTYICHPQMANNELSGPIISMSLINFFKKKNNNYSIRFLFIPETIGSIAYIHKNIKKLKKNVIAGYNLTCLGDTKNYSCIFSKYNNTISDKVLKETYKELNIKYNEYSFNEIRSDERQYNSYGIDLPIATVTRSLYGKYKEYHTSDDNFEYISLKGINESMYLLKKVLLNIDKSIIPITKTFCEPKLGKKNLYPKISDKSINVFSKRILNFLQYSDGKNNLFHISKKIKVNNDEINKIYKILLKNNLIY
tara:strand:+ start:102 stop:1394 length:1293 start_codon:yes stop_codon:yes gene_type:complete